MAALLQRCQLYNKLLIKSNIIDNTYNRNIIILKFKRYFTSIKENKKNDENIGDINDSDNTIYNNDINELKNKLDDTDITKNIKPKLKKYKLDYNDPSDNNELLGKYLKDDHRKFKCDMNETRLLIKKIRNNEVNIELLEVKLQIIALKNIIATIMKSNDALTLRILLNYYLDLTLKPNAKLKYNSQILAYALSLCTTSEHVACLTLFIKNIYDKSPFTIQSFDIAITIYNLGLKNNFKAGYDFYMGAHSFNVPRNVTMLNSMLQLFISNNYFRESVRLFEYMFINNYFNDVSLLIMLNALESKGQYDACLYIYFDILASNPGAISLKFKSLLSSNVFNNGHGSPLFVYPQIEKVYTKLALSHNRNLKFPSFSLLNQLLNLCKKCSSIKDAVFIMEAITPRWKESIILHPWIFNLFICGFTKEGMMSEAEEIILSYSKHTAANTEKFDTIKDKIKITDICLWMVQGYVANGENNKAFDWLSKFSNADSKAVVDVETLNVIMEMYAKNRQWYLIIKLLETYPESLNFKHMLVRDVANYTDYSDHASLISHILIASSKLDILDKGVNLIARFLKQYPKENAIGILIQVYRKATRELNDLFYKIARKNPFSFHEKVNLQKIHANNLLLKSKNTEIVDTSNPNKNFVFELNNIPNFNVDLSKSFSDVKFLFSDYAFLPQPLVISKNLKSDYQFRSAKFPEANSLFQALQEEAWKL